ncbi:MAG TPA: manganese efflux pump [Anaeromyxobacteraceae bacterium]|nr:manganese efflux pump [Anaeromyxobacteraceae bacterium]
MTIPETMGIAISLSMDGLAVAIATGMSLRAPSLRCSLSMAIAFGGAQASTLTVGWFVGHGLQHLVSLSPWVACAILGWIGGRMIVGGRKEGEASEARDLTRGFTLVALAFGTSLDGFGVGIPLGNRGTTVWWLSCTTAVTVGLITFLGSILGARIGNAWARRAELAGGVVLCLIGLKFLFLQP